MHIRDRMLLPSLSEIRKIRKRLGLSQMELAEKAGVSQSLIARVESGTVDPRYSKVEGIFKTLNELKRKGTIAGEIMTPSVVGIQIKSSVGRAAKLMRTYNVSQLPVFNGKKILGSVSEQMILEKVAEGMDINVLSTKRIDEFLEEPFPTVGVKTPITSISVLLSNNKAVLVVDRGEIRGIITNADLLKILKV
ncbi:MAG TPA: CBS domain-containing protein [Candidatus Altiarchaeales archaeon]|nr:CBS domain-containing protein [Candidatus Altiarchaeales archaeon]